MFSIHEYRGVAANGVEGREHVFVTRKPHFLLEILGFGSDEEGSKV